MSTQNTMLVGITMGMCRQSRQLTAIAGQIENQANAETGTVKASINYFKRREGRKEVDGLASLKAFQGAWKSELTNYARYPFAAGMKLLPAGLVEQFMAVNEKYRAMESEVWNTWARDEYPQWLASAPQRMGSLYDPADFPTAADCANRFICDVTVVPLAAAEQWQRVSLISPNLAVTMQKNQDEAVERARREAHGQLWSQVMGPIQHVVDMLSKDKTKLYPSLIENIVAIADLVPAYSEMHQDANLTALAQSAKEAFSQIKIEDLRDSAESRDAALLKARELVTQYAPYQRAFADDDGD